MPTYLAELVARTPALTGPPTLEVVAPLRSTSLSVTEELSRDGAVDLSVPLSQLGPDAKARLADPLMFPCEIRVERDRQLLWQGPLWTVGLQGQTVTIHARGLLAYLKYMVVGPDTGSLTFAGHDQHFIVRDLIDAWQTLDWGHYGLDTTAITASGQTRDRSYDAAELPDFYDLATKLGEVRGGFDLEVTADRRVLCHYPDKGQLRDAWLDARNIDSADEQRSVADGKVASVAYANTGDDEAALDIAVATDQAVLEAFGRAAHATSRDGVRVQSTLDDAAQAALDARKATDWQPGPGIRPVAEMGIDDVAVGDWLEYRYDAGLGLVSDQVRVVKRQVSVDADGAERLGLEVA